MAELTIINVVIINASKVLQVKEAEAEVDAAVAALRTQVERDFAHVWGKNAHIELARNDYHKSCPDLEQYQGWWWLVLLDTSDRAGALGYQDLTNEGRPLGKVFVQTAQDYGREWTVTASHELLEMLVDPMFNLSAFKETGEITGMFYAYDICDPCQEEKYKINDSVYVSDFVYPAWFEPFPHPTDTQFDHCKKLSEPFQLRPGGYINVFDISRGLGWRQLEAPLTDRKVPNTQPRPGSRRERRGRRLSAFMAGSDSVVRVELSSN